MEGSLRLKCRLIVGLLINCWLLCSCSIVPPPGLVAQGDVAPDFAFDDQSGRRHRLSDFRGKVVLVNFWATWCPPCREEMPSLQAVQNKFGQHALTILALSVDDSWEPINKFMKENGFTIQVYADFDKKISVRYGTFKYPETYLVDKKGRVAYKVVGPADWTSSAMLKFLNVLILEDKP